MMKFMESLRERLASKEELYAADGSYDLGDEYNSMYNEPESVYVEEDERAYGAHRASGRANGGLDASSYQSQVVIVRPQDYPDATSIIAYMRQSHVVLVNLECLLHSELRNALIHSLDGACTALDAKLEEVNDNIYLLIPRGVGFSENNFAFEAPPEESYVQEHWRPSYRAEALSNLASYRR